MVLVKECELRPLKSGAEKAVAPSCYGKSHNTLSVDTSGRLLEKL